MHSCENGWPCLLREVLTQTETGPQSNATQTALEMQRKSDLCSSAEKGVAYRAKRVKRTSGSAVWHLAFHVDGKQRAELRFNTHKAASPAPHSFVLPVIFLFLKGNEMSVEKVLRPQASYCAKDLVFDIFMSKCHHDSIYPFHETCNKLQVPLTVG